jgi:hypothetical protein
MALAVPVIQNARAVLEDTSASQDCQLISSTVQTMTRPESKMNVPNPEEWQQVGV